jgi:hypothetical protein
MSPLKIALLAVGGVAVVGTIAASGIFMYRKTKKTAASQPEAVDTAVQVENHVIEAAVVKTVPVEPTVDVVAEEPQPDSIIDTPLDADPVMQDDLYEVSMLPSILGKDIIIHGIEDVKTPDRFLFTNGAQQVIDDTMCDHDSKSVNALHSCVYRQISNILHHRGQVEYFTQKSRVGRLSIKTYTAPNRDPNQWVLVQITPNDSSIFGLRSISILVQRDDLVLSTADCDLESPEWKKQVGVIYAHLRHAVGNQNGATRDEMVGVRKIMGRHFLALGKRLNQVAATV